MESALPLLTPCPIETLDDTVGDLSLSYSNFVPIVQSSGTGKSWMVDQFVTIVFTLPFDLRSDSDTSGLLRHLTLTIVLLHFLPGYPRVDNQIRDYLSIGKQLDTRNCLRGRATFCLWGLYSLAFMR
ncbi:hypothetical protein BU17DRAFT_43963 [Hysterangium stoloniferum]|nr:hypothetical protein BU17DRAFT_43963 [Hysterangium stoloniferum]